MSKSILTKFSDAYSVQPEKMLGTLKTVAFKQYNGVDISNEQMIALLVVADQYKLNPFTREIYAFPDKGSIVPVVGLDGWSRIINSHPQFDGMDYNYSDEMVTLHGAKESYKWIECVMYRKDRQRPVVVRESLDEVYRPPIKGRNGPWQSHTKRMLRHKATIQCARLAFGFVGIYDEDEAERIIEKDITPTVNTDNVTVIRSKPAEIEHYPEEKFKKNFTSWSQLISSGKQSADTLIKMAASKGQPLSPNQIGALQSIK